MRRIKWQCDDRDLTMMVQWCNGIVLMVWLAVRGRWALDFGIPHYTINVGRFSYHTLVDLWSSSEIIHSSTTVQWWWLVLVGVQGSSVLLQFYSIGPSNTIGHKLWLPNCVRLGGRNTWGFLNFEATGISKAILEKEKTLHFHTPMGWRLLLELETHWTWVNLRTHMFTHFFPWDIIPWEIILPTV